MAIHLVSGGDGLVVEYGYADVAILCSPSAVYDVHSFRVSVDDPLLCSLRIVLPSTLS